MLFKSDTGVVSAGDGLEKLLGPTIRRKAEISISPNISMACILNQVSVAPL